MNALRRRIHAAMMSGGSGASGAWTPASLPHLQVWLDASQIVGLNDGDAVATWSDLSGNGNHYTQATASKRPTYKTGVQNSLPGVLGDGVDDILECAAINWTADQKATVFCVVKGLSSVTTVIYERSVNWNVNIGGIALFHHLFLLQAGVRTSGGSGSSRQTVNQADGVIVANINMSHASQALNATLNGSPFTTRTHSGSAGTLGNYQDFLFARIGSVIPYNGNILEFGICLEAVDSGTQTLLTDYLRLKWGY